MEKMENKRVHYFNDRSYIKFDERGFVYRDRHGKLVADASMLMTDGRIDIHAFKMVEEIIKHKVIGDK